MKNCQVAAVADFGNAFDPNAEKRMGDLPNFTNSERVVQVSELTQ